MTKRAGSLTTAYGIFRGVKERKQIMQRDSDARTTLRERARAASRVKAETSIADNPCLGPEWLSKRYGKDSPFLQSSPYLDSGLSRATIDYAELRIRGGRDHRIVTRRAALGTTTKQFARDAATTGEKEAVW